MHCLIGVLDALIHQKFPFCSGLQQLWVLFGPVSEPQSQLFPALCLSVPFYNLCSWCWNWFPSIIEKWFGKKAMILTEKAWPLHPPVKSTRRCWSASSRDPDTGSVSVKLYVQDPNQRCQTQVYIYTSCLGLFKKKTNPKPNQHNNITSSASFPHCKPGIRCHAAYGAVLVSLSDAVTNTTLFLNNILSGQVTPPGYLCGWHKSWRFFQWVTGWAPQLMQINNGNANI